MKQQHTTRCLFSDNNESESDSMGAFDFNVKIVVNANSGGSLRVADDE